MANEYELPFTAEEIENKLYAVLPVVEITTPLKDGARVRLSQEECNLIDAAAQSRMPLVARVTVDGFEYFSIMNYTGIYSDGGTLYRKEYVGYPDHYRSIVGFYWDEDDPYWGAYTSYNNEA